MCVHSDHCGHCTAEKSPFFAFIQSLDTFLNQTESRHGGLHFPTQYDMESFLCQYSSVTSLFFNRQVDRDQRRQWHPIPILLPGKSHGRRSLVDCSPRGLEESDTTEQLHFHFSLSCIGEGNGSPLQCSCLENPRDGGAWWAAVYGVAQSRTRLKQLSRQRYSIGWNVLAIVHPVIFLGMCV